ncbi:UTP--glucose-1-phosphate uridylyltransferase GalU [Tepidanaerobacter acetatoxydans]|uniref:UTP--glucose-1-phosphate uridylyltransferase GalU n=1 Tax=Tepidanaerobacter acetatoxydans TaxID=499229 RepID=UPI001BD60414|nr:UTP--glucose-1-phosphate uridylyltransferase GalU [Tepidanaerobacter acetatoxydans]
MKIRKAVIPAAGLGTRFLPATKAQPKEMLPIVDKPTIQFIVEEAVASGIEEILIITGRNKRAIEDHFDRSIELELELQKKDKKNLYNIIKNISNMAEIYYIRQKEPKGLGHAIYCARAFVGDEPFAVMLGDDIIDAEIPVLKQMIDVYEKYNYSIIGVQEIPEDEVERYGIADTSRIEERIYKVNNLVEKPKKNQAPSNIAISGRYIITPHIFNILKHAKPGADNEIQLTDALKELLNIEPIYAYAFRGNRYDVGDKLGYLKATVDYALKRNDLRDDFTKYLTEIISRKINKYKCL